MTNNNDVATEEFLQQQYPLHLACLRGDEAYLKDLLMSGRYDIYQEDGLHGWTPMHWAAARGKLGCLRELGQRPGIHDVHSSRSGETPTHVAAQEGHPQCLHWLLQHSNGYAQQDHMGNTPLHKAAQRGHAECARLLTSHGSMLSTLNYNGQTPLDIAVQNGHFECQEFLDHAMASLHPTFFPSSSSPILMNGEGIYQNDAVGKGQKECDQDMEMEEEMGSDGDAAGMLQPSAGCKRSFDDEEERSFKRRRLFASSIEDKLGTVTNNNVVSSYQGILAMSVEPLKPPSGHHHTDTQEGMECTNGGMSENEIKESGKRPRWQSMGGVGVCARREFDHGCSALRSHLI